MAFRVEIAPQAFDDIDSIAAYITEKSSFTVAERWFNGVMDDIGSLKDMPARYPATPESEELGLEVRLRRR
jgi:plasmid stabilization system protein ParE